MCKTLEERIVDLEKKVAELEGRVPVQKQKNHTFEFPNLSKGKIIWTTDKSYFNRFLSKQGAVQIITPQLIEAYTKALGEPLNLSLCDVHVVHIPEDI